MTSVILVKSMVHKTKIHNWSELMIPGLYLKFVILHQHWDFFFGRMNEENFCTFPEVFIWTSPLGPMDGNLSDSFEKTVVKEGGGCRRFQRAKERFLQWKIVNIQIKIRTKAYLSAILSSLYGTWNQISAFTTAKIILWGKNIKKMGNAQLI